MRLQKYLARAGVSSRRGAEALIRAGRVAVNGTVVREMGVTVEPDDRVEVDGRAVALEPAKWVMVHKPAGYVTTRDDPQGRPTVYDLLPARYGSLFHVGRLDLDSSGLLLLTNEGGVANRLMHPSHEVDRVYVVEVVGEAGGAERRRLLEGIELEDGPARAHRVDVLAREEARGGAGASAHTRLRIVMREGRKREVRRLFDALGHPVRRLRRERLGPVELGELGEGEWRELTAREVDALRRIE
ncbi:MAG: pseudouridine synthase [Gemmatimonadota bacterium]